MAEVEYRNQIVAAAHAARLDGMIILSAFRHGDLSRNVEDRRKIRRILKVKIRLPTSSRLSMRGRWLNRHLGEFAHSIPHDSLDLSSKRYTAVSASNCGNSASNRSNEDFVENPAGVGHLAGLRTYPLI